MSAGRRSRRPRRRWLVLAILVALAAAAATPIRVPPRWLAEPAAALLADRLQAQVQLGEAALTLLPAPRLRLGAGSIAKSEAQVGAAAGAPAAAGWTVRWTAVDLSPNLLALARGRPTLAGARLRGVAAAAAHAGRTWRLEGADLQVRGLDLDLRALAMATPAPTAPANAATGAAASPPSGQWAALAAGLLPDLRAAWTLQAASLQAGQAVWEGVTAAGTLRADQAKAERFAAACAGGGLAGDATLAVTSPQGPVLSGQVELTGVRAAVLLREWAPAVADDLDLTVDGRLQYRIPLTGGTAAAMQPAGGGDAVPGQGLWAQGVLQGGAGVIHARSWLTDVAPYLGPRQDLQDIRTSAWSLPLTIAGGRCDLTLALQGPDTDWTGKGWIGLDGTLDVRLTVALPAGYTPELGQWALLAEMLRDRERRLNLAFRLSGPLVEPQVGLDLAGLLGAGRSAP